MNKIELEIIKNLDELRFNQRLILSALRNILEQHNRNRVNDYLIENIEARLW